VARRLFFDQGFDKTTLDEICDDAEISRRTFFRYFSNKEALVFPNREDHLADFREFLDNPTEGESVFETLRRATRAFAVDYVTHLDALLATQRLINTSPALLAREREIDRAWERAMEEAFAREAGGTPEARIRARVLGGATIGVIRATTRYWFETEGRDDLEKLGFDALVSLERGFPLHDP
jgi:AcrR family transcriptional regulator